MQSNGKAIAPFEILLLLLLGILWGMPYALNKIALATIPPITMTAVRVALAAATLWVLVFANGCKWPDQRGVAGRLFVQGLIGCVVPYTLIAFGQQSVDSALASILNSTGPLFICLIGLVTAGKDAPTIQGLFGIVIGLAGVVVITGIGAFTGLGHASVGQLAILLATLSSAFGAIHARRFIAIAPEIVAAGTLTWSALLLMPLAFVVESPFHTVPSAPAVAALLTNAIVATALGFIVYFRLIRTLGSFGTMSVGYLRPGVGVLIGCAMLGESLTWPISCGLLLILIGVTTINLKSSSRSSRSITASVRNWRLGNKVAVEKV
jgi:drug/metabolite transporter (DMT)-like permease